MLSLFRAITTKFAPSASTLNNVCSIKSLFHTSSVMNKDPTRFIKHNEKMYPPQTENETPRNAFVCHQKNNIKYSPEKMWYIASFIRGMTIDEAIRQLRFVHKKGAAYIIETLLEAQDMAIKNHNVEFKSNLWVSESFVGKGVVYKGIRRHAKRRMGVIHYRHCHYFVTLEEGTPPKDYYGKLVTPEQQLNKWLEDKRNRKIHNSL